MLLRSGAVCLTSVVCRAWTLLEHSQVLKGELVNTGETWLGNPASQLELPWYYMRSMKMYCEDVLWMYV